MVEFNKWFNDSSCTYWWNLDARYKSNRKFNLFLTDGILGSNFTGFFEFDGDSNEFEISMDTTGLNGADFVNTYVDVTGAQTHLTST